MKHFRQATRTESPSHRATSLTWSLVSLLIIVVLSTACGAPAATAPAQPATQAPVAAELAKPADTSSGKLTIAQGLEPRSLWGNAFTGQQEINVAEQITEKLIEFTPDAQDYEPRLATEWKQVDPTTWQFKLRQGVKFTNGEEFDANSAVYSLGVTKSAPSYASWVSMIVTATVVDKHTINVITDGPTMLHLPGLAMSSFQYPAKYFAEVGKDTFGTKPVGTGPYKLVEWVKDDHISLEANPDYWGGPVSVKTIVFRNIPEGAARLAALQTGEIDFTIDVPLDAAEQIENNPDLQLFTRPSNRVFMLWMSNITDSPLKDPKVRQALQYAIDVDALTKALFKGRATKLQGQILTPSFFGFISDWQAKPYDPEKAKQMLAEAGYPNGFDFTFKYSAGRYVQDKEAGQAIAAQLAKVGARAKQEVLEPGTFLTQMQAKQLTDMHLGGYLPPPDAHFMYQQFRTGFVYSITAIPEIDELVLKGAASAEAGASGHLSPAPASNGRQPTSHSAV